MNNNIIERLSVAVVTEVNPDDGKTYITKLGEEASELLREILVILNGSPIKHDQEVIRLINK